MDSRDEIIIEVCGCLVHQVNMKLYIFIPLWQRYGIMVLGATIGFSVGGFLTFLFGDPLRGRIVGFLLGALLGSLLCERVGHVQKDAGEMIKNGFTSKDKSLFIEYVRIFFEGKRVVDTASTLSALSKKKDQEAAIRRTVAVFFRSELNYVVSYDMDKFENVLQ